ncbi:transferrin-binding protein-like solute binding protein, partial [Ursidibacter arcticus]
SDYQSYSGYAVIREESGLVDQPANAYVAVVTTPTTDKSLVVDATYKGNAVYSTKNGNAYAGYTVRGYNAELTLNVKNGVVSGDIKSTVGRQPTIATFNDADIQVANNGLVFEGNAKFNTAAPLALTGAKDAAGQRLESIDGIYKGQFAGANAEEVVGTFETNSTEKDFSVQGSFMGKK